MKIIVTCLLVLAAATSAASPPAAPCGQPEAAQFDFWLGTWDVYAKDELVGRNVIAKVHNGCTVLESYQGVKGPYEGSSFNWYDPVGDRWHQVWVDNGGTRLDLAGGFEDGSMVMSGMRTAGDRSVADRITWTPREDGTVRQLWEQTTDGGETWTTAFDGLYRKAEKTE